MRVFAKFLNRYIYFSKSSSASLLRNLCLLPFRTGTNKKSILVILFASQQNGIMRSAVMVDNGIFLA